MDLGQYDSQGEYCCPHTSSSVFLILIHLPTVYSDSNRLSAPRFPQVSAAHEEVPGRRGFPGYIYSDSYRLCVPRFPPRCLRPVRRCLVAVVYTLTLIVSLFPVFPQVSAAREEVPGRRGLYSDSYRLCVPRFPPRCLRPVRRCLVAVVYTLTLIVSLFPVFPQVSAAREEVPGRRGLYSDSNRLSAPRFPPGVGGP